MTSFAVHEDLLHAARRPPPNDARSRRATFREGQREAIEAVDRRRARGRSSSSARAGARASSTGSRRGSAATRATGRRSSSARCSPLMRNQIAMAGRLGLRAATINSGNTAEWDDVEAGLAADAIDVLLDLARAPRQRGLREPDPARDPGIDRPVRRRRGALHQRLGPRLPARLPADRPDPAQPLAGDPGPRDDGDGERPGRRGRRRAARARASGSSAGRWPAHRSGSTRSRCADQAERLAWLAEHLPNLPGSGIVYCLTVADTQRVADLAALARHRRPCLQRGRSSTEEREALEDALIAGEIKALVATVALGMGFDKPDLGLVVHYQRPGSPIAYYQQVGRAGRAVDSACGHPPLRPRGRRDRGVLHPDRVPADGQHGGDPRGARSRRSARCRWSACSPRSTCRRAGSSRRSSCSRSTARWRATAAATRGRPSRGRRTRRGSRA